MGDPLLAEERGAVLFALQKMEDGDPIPQPIAVMLLVIVLRLLGEAAVVIVDLPGPPDHTVN